MHFSIANDRLIRDGVGVPFVPSPNHGGRIEPALIVVHFTADRLVPNDSVNWFAQKKSKVSAHIVLGRNQSDPNFITQMVEFDQKAWHCDPSLWRGKKGVNGFSIGIEVDNPGALAIRGKDQGVAWFGEVFDRARDGLVEVRNEKYGHALWLPYTAAQMAALEGIIAALLEAYPSIVDVRGHDEICDPPKRKNDPGPLMAMDVLRAMLPAHRRALASVKDTTVAAAQRRLAALGYFPGEVDNLMGPRTRSALRTFQEQNGITVTGGLDTETWTMLSATDAKPMPTGARESAHAAQPAATSSGQLVKRGAEGTALVTLAEAAASPSVPAPPVLDPVADPLAGIGAVERGIATAEKGRAIADRGAGLIDWLMTPQGTRVAVTLAVCLLIWWLAHRSEARERLGRLKGWILGEVK
jgi:N-acetylmuramoyl-L-alanine amidase